MLKSFSIFCLAIVIILPFTAISVPITPYKGNHPHKKQVDVAIAMVFQNEAQWLKEWIEYHRLMGVKHFYLYNNLSNDTYLEVLQPYIEKGIVELFDFPEHEFNTASKPLSQIETYNHAIRLAKNKAKWLAIIDSDEFICPVKCDTLIETLKNYEDASGIALFWQVYGTSRIKKLLPGELLIEKLTYKMAPHSYDKTVFKTIKMIFRPKHVIKMLDAHIAKFKTNYFAVFPDHLPFQWPALYGEALPIDDIRINHYTFRTEDYFYNIKLPRMLLQGYAPGSSLVPQSTSELLNSCNAVEDRIMDRFVPQLRQNMKNK
jgi:hypothetical protein